MGNSLSGIHEIELVPEFGQREVVGRLQRALNDANKLQAAIAYWCLGVKELGSTIIERLSGDGFLCADIHLPTDIDRLCEMKVAGANIYLYLLNPNPQKGELRSKVPPHLLHPKMLLFDFPSEAAELWVGSHNWTARSLTGVNIEASLRVRLDKESALYTDSHAFLEAIRANCEHFDPSAVAYYKWLQESDQPEEVWVLEIRGSRSLLDKARMLTVFGRAEDDYRNLKSVDKSVVISLFDAATGMEVLYEAVIRDTGYRPKERGVTFDSRVYAAHDGTALPKLEGPKVPDSSIIQAANSWATMDILDELFGKTYEIPPTQRWVPTDDRAQRVQIPPAFRRWFPNPDKPLVQRAISRSEFEGRTVRAEDESPLKTPLYLESRTKLLRRKVVRATRRDGQIFTLKGGRKNEQERK